MTLSKTNNNTAKGYGMKINYRHSLKSMRMQMARFNETFLYTMENGKPVFTVKELFAATGKLTQTCGHFHSCSEMAEYINKRNGMLA